MVKRVYYDDWNVYKVLLLNKDAVLQEEGDNATHYNVFFVENTVEYACDILKGSPEATDYETNFQPNVNAQAVVATNIVGIGGEEVGVIGDRLKVDAEVTVNAENRFRPKFSYSKSDISLSQGSYTDLFNINVDGKVDALSMNFDRDDVFVQIEVDGVVIYDEENERLASDSDYALECGNNYGDDD